MPFSTVMILLYIKCARAAQDTERERRSEEDLLGLAVLIKDVKCNSQVAVVTYVLRRKSA